jgi:hypothetical protein
MAGTLFQIIIFCQKESVPKLVIQYQYIFSTGDCVKIKRFAV